VVWLHALIAASMPSGVEHVNEQALAVAVSLLIAASMPSGVEHTNTNTIAVDGAER